MMRSVQCAVPSVCLCVCGVRVVVVRVPDEIVVEWQPISRALCSAVWASRGGGSGDAVSPCGPRGVSREPDWSRCEV